MTPSRDPLDVVLPTYDVVLRHTRVLRGSASGAYEAFSALTLGEMPLPRLLFAARSLPARLAGSPGLPSRRDEPLLDQFLALGLVLLIDLPGREIVVGESAR